MLIRIITALVLAPLALAAIYLLDRGSFALLVAALVGLAGYEWAGLVFAPAGSDADNRSAPPASAINNPLARLILAILFLSAAMALCGWLWLRPDMQPRWLVLAAVCWGWAIVEVLLYPRQVVASEHAGVRRNLRWVVFGLVVLPGAWVAMLLLKQSSPHLLVMACFLVWGADAGAYFVGKAIGRRKLAPQVSPGKTWEGAIGGGLVGVLVALGFGLLMIDQVAQNLPLVALSLIFLVVVSVFGDLFESILKRTAGAKDSGRLLPGHGGILDRIDALIAVLPLMALLALAA